MVFFIVGGWFCGSILSATQKKRVCVCVCGIGFYFIFYFLYYKKIEKRICVFTFLAVGLDFMLCDLMS